jgi:hypothetical protein
LGLAAEVGAGPTPVGFKRGCVTSFNKAGLCGVTLSTKIESLGLSTPVLLSARISSVVSATLVSSFERWCTLPKFMQEGQRLQIISNGLEHHTLQLKHFLLFLLLYFDDRLAFKITTFVEVEHHGLICHRGHQVFRLRTIRFDELILAS